MIDSEESHRFAVTGNDRGGHHRRTIIGWRETGLVGPNQRLVRQVVLMLDATPNTEVVLTSNQATELLRVLAEAAFAPAVIPKQGR